MDSLDKQINIFKNNVKLNSILCSYGEITHKNSIDLSLNNCLAICTQKNLVLYSLNLQYDEKSFNLKQKSTQLLCYNVKIIEKPQISNSLKSILLKYYELNTRIKRKSLANSTLNGSQSKKSRLSITKSEENSLIDDDTLIDESFEANDEQYKTLQIQQRLLSSIFIPQLTKLNPFNPQQQNQQPNETNGFRYCKWIKCLDILLLATITLDNQIIVYYFEEILNSIDHPADKYFNLTELWMETNVVSLLVTKKEDLIDTELNLMPISMTWSDNFTINNQMINILFVAFKSNQIAAFYCCKTSSILHGFKYSSTISLKNLEKSQKRFKDGLVDFSFLDSYKCEVASMCCYKLNEISFILVIGLSNGSIIIKICEILNDFSIIETKTIPSPQRFIRSRPPKKIQIETIDKNEYLIVLHKDFYLGFMLVNLNKDQIDDVTFTKNYSQAKIINFSIADSKNLIYSVFYENSLIDLVKVSINESKIKLIQDKIQYSLKLNETNSNLVTQQTSIQMLLSSNQSILYRIFNVPRAPITQKKPPDFIIEFYSLDNSIDNFLKIFSCETNNLRTLSDCIWLFKRHVKQNQNFISKIIPKSNEISKQNKSEDIIKRLRIIMINLYNFFKMKESINNRNDDNSDDENKSIENDGVIRSPNYYQSIFVDLSLSLIKNPIINLLEQAYKCGFQNLTTLEKYILLIQSDFVLKKKLYDKKSIIDWVEYCFNEKSDGFLKHLWSTRCSSDSLNLKTQERFELESYMKCYLCEEAFDLRKNYNLCYFECESGHKIHRCEKTLVPLNYTEYKKCKLCFCCWNIYKRDELPNLSNLYFDKFNFCLYCE